MGLLLSVCSTVTMGVTSRVTTQAHQLAPEQSYSLHSTPYTLQTRPSTPHSAPYNLYHILHSIVTMRVTLRVTTQAHQLAREQEAENRARCVHAVL